jgi:hypothetical protein
MRFRIWLLLRIWKKNKPHGNEWKYFSTVDDSFYTPEIFPSQLLPLLARSKTTASSDTDTLCLWH